MIKFVKIKKPEKKTLCLYFLFLVIMITVVAGKKNLCGDEVFSYTLANGAGYVRFEEGVTYQSPQKLFANEITVNNTGGGRFDFENVWRNQENDVHPPLYYLILHIICSCYAGRFSIWYAAGINILFAVLTLYIWRKFMRFYINDKIFIDFISIIFITSEGILQNISFFRMYVMAMFWVTLTAYLFVKALIEKVCWKHWILIDLVAISGALTHYYCIIYLGITCMVFVLCMIIQRRWKEIVLLVSHMLISAIVSIAIFPAMISHIFFGYRGTESMDNFANATWEEHWERLKVYYGFIDKQMLGVLGGGFVVLVILLIIMFVVLHKNQGVVQFHFCKQQVMKVMIVGIPVIFYFGLVSMSAPYLISRYLFPIYAVALGIFMYLIFVVLNKLLMKQNIYIAICFIGTVMILDGVGSMNGDFLFKESVALLDKAAEYSDQNCISIYDEEWKEMSSFYELRNYKSVTFIQQKNIDRIVQYDELFGDSFILTVIGGNDEQIVCLIQDHYPHLTQCEKLGAYEYSTTYRIHADEGET